MSEAKLIVRNHEARARAAEVVLNLDDSPYEVTVKPFKKRRSLDQNARYWWLLATISTQVSDETGKKYAPETWHEYLKAEFLGKDTILIDGSPKLVHRTTTKLNVMDFMDYMTQVEAWAVEHGVRFDDQQRGNI